MTCDACEILKLQDYWHRRRMAESLTGASQKMSWVELQAEANRLRGALAESRSELTALRIAMGRRVGCSQAD